MRTSKPRPSSISRPGKPTHPTASRRAGATASTAPPAAPQRGNRTDGDATRQHLLETAGQVFAERGFAETTSKAICERAGTQLAAVNYHFGSREALYEAVLVEAHKQIVAVEELEALAQGPGTARDKFMAVLQRMIGLSSGAVAAPWGLPVVLREVMSPSNQLPVLVEKAIRPKAAIVIGLVSDMLGLPPSHAVVQRALVFTVLPVVVMLLVPKALLTRILPGAARGGAGFEDDLIRYVSGGLDAMLAEHAAPATSASRVASRKRKKE